MPVPSSVYPKQTTPKSDRTRSSDNQMVDKAIKKRACYVREMIMTLQACSPPSANLYRIAFVFFAGVLVFSTASSAQTFTVLHTFTWGTDGGYPYAGLIIDGEGNLYGTANQGGDRNYLCGPANEGCGTVFELSPTNGGWGFRTLYTFQGGTNDGQGPYGRVAFGPDGALYGTTIDGGNQNCPSGCGLVFSLTPTGACSSTCWAEKVLYEFQGGTNDGFYPTGDLAFDSSGNVYGTTTQGVNYGPGTVYELTPSNGQWAETVLYSFNPNGTDAANPYSGVIFDQSGNIYGTTPGGGMNESGAVFKLTPSANGWTESLPFASFQGDDGVSPMAGLLLTPSGVLIGATQAGGVGNGGTIFTLTPSNGNWTFATLYDFPGSCGDCGPYAKLIADAKGNLYGTTQGGGEGNWGSVFKLTLTGHGWVGTVLHLFTGGADGSTPYSTLVLDSAGNIYGTTLLGGESTNGGYGVVFEITP
jgi:uncharacterized repeat protein (TIGR03803 family)